MITRLSLLILCFCYGSAVHAQGQWAWEWGPQGNTTLSSSGQGNFSATNHPGWRYAAVCWTDPNGKFWRYGGDGGGDLWQFDPLLGQWAFMNGSLSATPPTVYGTQGISAPGNQPGGDAFGHPAWVDNIGNLWIYSIGSTDDLWKFDPIIGQWTWMKGTGSNGAAAVYGVIGVPSPAVSPGQCNETDCKWVDSNNNLWLFNEFTGVLWKYDPSLNQWAWIKGTPNGNPVYGTLGIAAPANEPGQFSGCPSVGTLYGMWQDSQDQLWMLVNRNGGTIDLEIWKYNIPNNEWTCMRIDASAFGGSQSYPNQCQETATAFPVPRTEQRARWVDDCDHLWTYGGIGFCQPSTEYADLWRYSPHTNQWMWVKGTNTGPVFGTQGVASASNQPPPAAGQQHWENEDGFWLHGGQTSLGSGTHHLWRYQPDTVVANFSETSICLTSTFTDLSTSGCNTIKSYAWNFGDAGSGTANTDTTPNPSHTFSNSGSYQVTLVVQNCTWHADTIVQTITVNCGLHVTLPSDTICVGDCTTLFANASGGSLPYSYQWDNGIPDTTGGPITVCPIANTTYSVIVTDSSGTSDTATATVVVLPTPIVDLGPDTALCHPPLLLDATNNSANYLWSDGSTSSSLLIQNSSTYSVNVSNAGCTTSDSINIQIANLNIDLGPDSITCHPNLLLDAGVSGLNYLWQDGSTQQSFTAVDTGTYIVQATDSLGCTAADTINILPGSISIDLGPDTVACAGSVITLQVGNTNANLQWSTGHNGQVETVNTPSTVWVSAVDGICQSSDTVEVLFQSPTASFASPDTSGCAPLSSIFTDLSSGGNAPIAQWAWDFGDGNTSSVQHPQHTFQQPGTYDLSLLVTDQNGCQDDTTNALFVEVFPEPSASFTFTPQHPDLNHPQVQFEDLSMGANTWHWTFGDGNFSNHQNPIHTYTAAGTYTVTLTVTNEFGCTASAEYLIVIASSFSLYVPNAFTPNADGINDIFRAEGEGVSEFHLSIFNRWGELIFESNALALGWDGTFRGSAVESEVYIWKIDARSKDHKFHQLHGHVTLVR